MESSAGLPELDTSGPPPRVTVVLIFLNGERYLPEAIDSVLAQDYPSFELVLVDDGSGEAATTLARGYAARHPGRVRYIDHPNHANYGMSASRNAGVRAGRGDLIAFIDADDVWLPNKLTDQVAIMDAHPEVELVAGAANYWRSWRGGRDEVILNGSALDVPVHPPDALLGIYPFGTAEAACPSTFLVRRSGLAKVGGFEESFRGMYEDQAFLAKAYLNLVMYFPSQWWLMYRQHDDSCSSIIERDGKMSEVRVGFARWFNGYVRRIGVRDRRVLWKARLHWLKVWYFYIFRTPMLLLERSRTYRRIRRQWWLYTARRVRNFG